jgi:hypothetical protein
MRRAMAVVLVALVAPLVVAPDPVAATSAPAPVAATAAAPCPTFDLASLFFEDYYAGTTWTAPGTSRTIRWTPFAATVNGESVARAFSASELALVRESFAAWDATLDSIAFQEVAGDAPAEVAIGWTAIADQGASVDGYWNAWWGGDRFRTRGTIRLRASSSFLAEGGAAFRHGVMHELGNLLGLGDIQPRPDVDSTQEDPWQPPYGPAVVGAFDRAVIRQMYGESTCPDAAVAAPVVTYRIRCVRGSKVRVVKGPDPVCPAGFRPRGKRVPLPAGGGGAAGYADGGASVTTGGA